MTDRRFVASTGRSPAGAPSTSTAPCPWCSGARSRAPCMLGPPQHAERRNKQPFRLLTLRSTERDTKTGAQDPPVFDGLHLGSDDNKNGTASSSQAHVSNEQQKSSRNRIEELQKSTEQDEEADQSPAVRAALFMLQFYRKGISPLMPSTCRYIPTCSNYSIDSYKQFGAVRGSVLTAWRLMRCNPFGGSGLDLPKWPPPGLEAVFKYKGSEEVALLVGVCAFTYIVHDMWIALVGA